MQGIVRSLSECLCPCKDRKAEIERQKQREESFSNKCLCLEGQTAQQSTRLASPPVRGRSDRLQTDNMLDYKGIESHERQIYLPAVTLGNFAPTSLNSNELMTKNTYAASGLRDSPRTIHATKGHASLVENNSVEPFPETSHERVI